MNKPHWMNYTIAPSTERWLLELGAEEVVGKDEQGKAIKEWKSRGFYKKFADDGPVIVATQEEAYIFPLREYAENVKHGDVRLKESRVVEA